ncbi:hypothetical protein B5F07_21245 [Lachnoclostridium sp. An169]|uniref:hypothetical protein n=1 Tax=Lachnoclostridium sp. An169 TaxID=1965569 RepID=UPI000B37BB1E|nr:hypothetical protein [Lachnoclostridium sp. An169]OUP80037.1 hypothetical protein B5F07_21245 [Lachnoclostridium sp. An169]
MSRKLIIDGNAVYEIDEECMLQKRVDSREEEKPGMKNSVKGSVRNTVISDDEKGHMRRG